MREKNGKTFKKSQIPFPKVLLIRLSSLGDLVLLSSTLEMLKNLGSTTYLVTSREYKELYQEDSRVKHVYTVNKNLKTLFKLIKKLRQEHFDLVVDLHFKLKTFILTLFSGAKIKRIYNKRIIKRNLAVKFKYPLKEVPVITSYARPIQNLLGINYFPPRPRLEVKEDSKIIPQKPYAVLAPGAKHATKRWPYFLPLANALLEVSFIKVVSVGTGDERKLFPARDNSSFLNLMGETTLKELLVLIKNAEFVVSNDSGVAHIAAALAIPLYVFFGPTIKEFGFRPQGEKVTILEKEIPCRPCSLHGEKACKRGDLVCLSSITVDQVLVLISETFKHG